MTAKKICIIEDDSMLLGVLLERLTDEGYLVSGFAKAETAIEYIEAEKPDIVLTDLVLSNMDGFEIIRIISSRADLKNIPVIILSNLGDKADIDRAISLGASDFMIKSDLSLEDIIKRIKNVIKHKEKKPDKKKPIKKKKRGKG
jgi:two-component system alkaline phosphatase synthesis response regulator PhoP